MNENELDYPDLLAIYEAGEPLTSDEYARLFNVRRPAKILARVVKAEAARPYPHWRHGGRRESHGTRHADVPHATACRLRELRKKVRQ